MKKNIYLLVIFFALLLAQLDNAVSQTNSYKLVAKNIRISPLNSEGILDFDIYMLDTASLWQWPFAEGNPVLAKVDSKSISEKFITVSAGTIPAFQLIVRNIHTNPGNGVDSTLDFDIYLQDITQGPHDPFNFAAAQYYLNYNTGIGTGITLRKTGSDLPLANQSPTFSADNGRFACAPNIPANNNVIVPTTGPGIKVLSLRAKTTQLVWNNVPLNLIWRSGAPNPFTKIAYFEPNGHAIEIPVSPNNVYQVVPAPTPDFSSDKRIILPGESINFFDQSAGGPTEWHWTFEGGNPPVSNDTNPQNIFYSTPGLYSVKLRIANENGTDSITKTDYIRVGLPLANFYSDRRIIQSGESVNFFDSTLNNATSWQWTFEGGNPSVSNDSNPSGIVYANEGIFQVKLVVSNIYGTDSSTKFNYITVGDSPIANFYSNLRIINPGQSINFFDSTLHNVDTWQWSFSGGTPSTSNVQNPSNIVYNSPGIYDVKLHVTNEFGSDSILKSGFIQVGNAPIANFYSDIRIITPGQAVNFFDSTMNEVTSWSWIFEGGTPPTSTDSNPSNIIYNQLGGFSVTLIVSGTFGADTVTKQNYIQVGNKPVTNFYSNKRVIGAGDYVNFFDSTLNNPANWQWIFEGGTPSLTNDTNPANIFYNTPGNYSVKLRTSNQFGADSITKIDYITVTLQPIANFYSDRRVIASGEAINFFDSSRNLPESWQWTFEGGTPEFSSDTNPSGIIYNKGGNFSVKLRVMNSSGEDSIIKTNYITVVKGAPVANFYSNRQAIFRGQTIDFFDSTLNGATSWQWTFTGGSPSSSAVQNPANIRYNTTGNFPVKLRVANAIGSDSIVKENYITVTVGAVPTFRLTAKNIHTNPNNGVDSTLDFDIYLQDISTGPHDHFNYAAGQYYLNYNTGIGTGITLRKTGSDLPLANQCVTFSAAFGRFACAPNIPANNNFIIPTTAPGTRVLSLRAKTTQTVWNNVPIDLVWRATFPGPYTKIAYFDSSGQVIEIPVSPNNEYQVETTPVANFYSNKRIIMPGESINFFDSSFNSPSQWQWTFDGASPSVSNDTNPQNVFYNNPGLYPVKLRVSNEFGSDSVTKIDYIRVGLPVANFYSDRRLITTGESVNFFDSTINTATSWSWTFTGGTPSTSNDSNPANIIYNSPGIYSVKLVASNSFGTDSITKTNYITVGDLPVANFFSDRRNIVMGDTIDFFDSSLHNPTSWIWTFTGGTPSTSVDSSPSNIVYNTPGNFAVKLRVANGFGTDSITKENYITVSPRLIANFYSDARIIAPGQSVNFFDSTQNGPADSWQWTFPGGTPSSSNVQNPANIVYDSVGTYAVKLRVISQLGSDSITKTDYISVISGVTPAFRLTVKNIHTNPLNGIDSTFDFDIYLQDITIGSHDAFNYAAGQFHINYNTGIGTGITLRKTGSDLPPGNQSPTFSAANGRFSCAPNIPVDNGFIIPSTTPGTKVLSLRAKTSQLAWNIVPPNLVWRTTGTAPITKLSYFNPVGVVIEIPNVNGEFGVDSNDPLPVNLASFTSAVNRNNVTLNWSTESETNNSCFEIERKPAGTFEWINVGTVSGSGTTNEIRDYTFSDRASTGTYHYRLKQLDFNGNVNYFKLNNEVLVGIPTKYAISQNYPNPFNPSTKIDFDLAKDGKVNIIIYDISGRQVGTILDEVRTAGYYTVHFNASNLATGMYLYRIVAGDFVQTKKMVLVK